MESITMTSLSGIPHKPSLLMTFPTCKLLFDCAVDTLPMCAYAPCSMIPKTSLDLTDYPNENTIASEFSNFRLRPRAPPEDLDPWISLIGHAGVEAVPQVNYVFNSNINLSELDAVFISNWDSLKALPFLTRNKELICPIYAAEPVTSLGGMIIEELIHFLERVDRASDDKQWVDAKAWDKVVGEDWRKSVPIQWQGFYDKAELENALSRITRVAVNQTITVGRTVKVNLFPSGFDIGSCNWSIEISNLEIGYWAASSQAREYMHEMETKRFRQLDVLIPTSLREVAANPGDAIANICATIVSNLKKGGNVLVPTEPVGPFYGLIECLIGEMDRSAPNQCYPVYIISPVASRAHSWTNISGEWFNESRRNSLFDPKMPFHIKEFIENKRVYLYNSIHGDFSSDYRVPCVVFAGHPSLRIGDAVYFTELWGGNAKNLAILTHPDFPFDAVWEPFRHLKMRGIGMPLDLRLTTAQLNQHFTSNKADVKKVVLAADYSNHNSLPITHPSLHYFKPCLPIELVKTPDIVHIVCYSDKVKKKLDAKTGIVQGYLNHLEDCIEWMPLLDLSEANAKTLQPLQNSSANISGKVLPSLPFKQRYRGNLSDINLKKALDFSGYRSIIVSPGTVSVPALDAKIIISGTHGARIRCSNTDNRMAISKVLENLLRNELTEHLAVPRTASD
uniref:Beta-Casp domain-containing protein n=1 Tax=Panagrellus redivivus TaxID=6233 RepID=A0A7E4VPT3_PANRE